MLSPRMHETNRSTSASLPDFFSFFVKHLMISQQLLPNTVAPWPCAEGKMVTWGKGIIFLKGNLYIYHLHVEVDHLGRWLCVYSLLMSRVFLLSWVFGGGWYFVRSITLNVGFCLRGSGNSNIIVHSETFSQSFNVSSPFCFVNILSSLGVEL